jgi:hypothetical protein
MNDNVFWNLYRQAFHDYPFSFKSTFSPSLSREKSKQERPTFSAACPVDAFSQVG